MSEKKILVKNCLEGLPILGLLAFHKQGKPPITGGLLEVHAQESELYLFL